MILRYVVSLITSVIIVRSGLPKEDIGTYEWILFFVHSGTFFFHHGLTTYLMASYEKQDIDDKSKFVSGIYTLGMVFASFVGILLLGIVIFSPNWLLFKSLHSFIYYILGYIFVMSALAPLEIVYFVLDKSKHFLKYIHFSQIGLLILFFTVALMGPSIEHFLMVLIGFGVIRWVYFMLSFSNTSFFTADYRYIFTVFIGSLPILGNQMISMIMEVMDGWMVKYFFSDATFAVFRYGARELPLSNFLFAGLSMAYISILQTNGFDLLELKQKVNKLMYFTFPIAIILMLSSPFIFGFVYTDTFRESAIIFNVYLLILISRVLLPQTILLAKQQFNIIMYSTIIEIIANITLSLWWVKIWGLKGLVFATVIAYLIQKVVLIMYNTRVNHIKIQDMIHLKHYILLSFGLILTFYFSYHFVL